jgi:hypothetical protein
MRGPHALRPKNIRLAHHHTAGTTRRDRTWAANYYYYARVHGIVFAVVRLHSLLLPSSVSVAAPQR